MHNQTPRVNGPVYDHTNQICINSRDHVAYYEQPSHETRFQMHDAAAMTDNISRTVYNTINPVDVMSQTLPLHNSNYNNNNNNNYKIKNANNLNRNSSSSSVNSIYSITPNLFDIIPSSPSLVPMTLSLANTGT